MRTNDGICLNEIIILPKRRMNRGIVTLQIATAIPVKHPISRLRLGDEKQEDTLPRGRFKTYAV